MNRYFGFYSPVPFWADSAPDFKYGTTIHPDDFHTIMSEPVFEETNGELTLRIDRDGQILFRIETLERQYKEYVKDNLLDPSELVEIAKNYLDYINIFYMLLDSECSTFGPGPFLTLSEITTQDIFIYSYDGTQGCMNIPTQSITSHFLNGRYLSNYQTPWDLSFDSRISRRIAIPYDTIKRASAKLFSLTNPASSFPQITSFAKSIAEYKVGSYDMAILLSWFTIESITNKLFENFIDSRNLTFDDGRKRINRRRKDEILKLNSEKIIHLLEILDIINFDLFETIQEVRKYRNHIAHAHNTSHTDSQARTAISAANKTISLMWQLDITPNLNYSITS